MMLTAWQDVVIDLLEGPAARVEALTGRSIHYVTAALYAIGLLLPVEKVLLFGADVTGLLFLPVFVGVVSWRLREALALARRGPARDGNVRTMAPDRASPWGIAGRLVWTPVTIVALVLTVLAIARGHAASPATALAIPVFALFLAFHLHACSPPPASASRRRSRRALAAGAGA